METTTTVNLSSSSIAALAEAIGDAVSFDTTVTISETLTASIPETLTANVASVGYLDPGALLALCVVALLVSAIYVGGVLRSWIRSQR